MKTKLRIAATLIAALALYVPIKIIVTERGVPESVATSALALFFCAVMVFLVSVEAKE